MEHRTFSARLDCHYILRPPDAGDSNRLLVVALHGFGANPDVMLHLTAGMFGPRHVIASIQGPNQFFLSPGKPDVGFGWGAGPHGPACVRLHHEIVMHVLDDAGRAYGIPPERRVLVGFSQPVSFNYRFAATCPKAVRGVVALCGGIPGDWETGAYQPVAAAVLHIAREGDEFYPPKVTEQYPARLRNRISDLEFHLLEGGHRFPSKGAPIVERWLGRILGSQDRR